MIFFFHHAYDGGVFKCSLTQRLSINWARRATAVCLIEIDGTVDA